MHRDVAIRLDGYLGGVRASLNAAAQVPKDNVPPDEYRGFAIHIAEAMGDTIDLSNKLFAMFPDIVPPELMSDVPKDAPPGV